VRGKNEDYRRHRIPTWVIPTSMLLCKLSPLLISAIISWVLSIRLSRPR
jgi:hypothetical protein